MGISGPPAIGPVARNWMLFVDGENLTIRAQNLAAENNITLAEGACHRKDAFVWLPDHRPTALTNVELGMPLLWQSVRAYYYTSVTGDDSLLIDVQDALWNLGFDPHVFKKERRSEKAKGVDIALTKDMLSHAFLGNYEAAVLIAGDGDYVPLVEEVKRLGKNVYVSFFAGHGLNPELRRAADSFNDLTEPFTLSWRPGGFGGREDDRGGAP